MVNVGKEHKKFTAEELAKLPEAPSYELINGDLVDICSYTFFQQLILGVLVLELREFLKVKPQGKLVLAPVDLCLSDADVFHPDILFVANENLDIVRDTIDGAPDLVIEMLNHQDPNFNTAYRAAVYAAAGVKEYWLFEARDFSFHAMVDDGEGNFRTAAKLTKTGSYRSAVLNGFELALERIF